MKTRSNMIRNMVVTAMLGAVATVLMFFDFSIPFLIPSFVKMDVSELPALLAAFSLGPVSGIAVCLIKNVINVFFTTTGCIGEVCNFLLGATFAGVAGLIYKYKKTRTGAVIAAVAGALAMAVISVPVNYFISYPVYAAMFGGMDKVLAAYEALRPGTDGLMECLLIFNAPFTLFKGLVDAVLAFLIYKPLSPVLHGRH